MFTWLRRRRLRARPFPPGWQDLLDAMPFFRHLGARAQTRLRSDLRILVAEKSWEGCGGYVMDDATKVTIAAHAARLLLGLRHAYYRRTHSILVYPSAFLVPNQRNGHVVSESVALSGQAWGQGPVILAWDDVERCLANPRRGRNTILHEFAHKLDMLDGFADGAPPLRSRKQYDAWQRVMTDHFDQLVDDVHAGRGTLLDEYGATNPAEFFAVCTELFFERSKDLKARHPELHALLVDYYRQDPGPT